MLTMADMSEVLMPLTKLRKTIFSILNVPAEVLYT